MAARACGEAKLFTTWRPGSRESDGGTREKVYPSKACLP
jgi:hypothetical protein